MVGRQISSGTWGMGGERRCGRRRQRQAAAGGGGVSPQRCSTRAASASRESAALTRRTATRPAQGLGQRKGRGCLHALRPMGGFCWVLLQVHKSIERNNRANWGGLAHRPTVAACTLPPPLCASHQVVDHWGQRCAAPTPLLQTTADRVSISILPPCLLRSGLRQLHIAGASN